MTIKKRLFWSNLYMILIPVIVTSIVGVICIAFMWLALIHGVGFGIHDQEEFDLACEVLSEDVEKKIGTSKDFQSIESILDSNEMAMQLYADSEKFYSHGEEKSQDAALKKSLDLLEENATISQNGRAMYVQHLTKNGVAYQIYFAGIFASVRNYANMKTGIIFAAIAIILLVIPRKRKTGSIVTASLVINIIVVNLILKNVFARVRPFNVNTVVQLLVSRPTDYSFPSGHTAMALTVVTALFLAGEKKFAWPALVLAVLIAFSRMYLYVHYPTDILGGVVVGILCGLIGKWFINEIEKKKKMPVG